MSEIPRWQIRWKGMASSFTFRLKKSPHINLDIICRPYLWDHRITRWGFKTKILFGDTHYSEIGFGPKFCVSIVWTPSPSTDKQEIERLRQELVWANARASRYEREEGHKLEKAMLHDLKEIQDTLVHSEVNDLVHAYVLRYGKGSVGFIFDNIEIEYLDMWERLGSALTGYDIPTETLAEREEIFEQMLHSEQTGIRYHGAHFLGVLGTERSRSMLLKAFESEKSKSVRSVINAYVNGS